MTYIIKNVKIITIAFVSSALLTIVIAVTAHTNGKLGERKKWAAKLQKEQLELSEAARQQERANALKIAQIDQEGLNKLKELEHEKNSIIADLKHNNIRLSVPTKTKSGTEANNASLDYGETRAELSDEAFGFLAGEAERADKITVQLGACQKVVGIELE